MNCPLAIARQTHILQTLDTTGSVGVGELAERFGVSRETIRRDLKALAETGRVNIVHGGAAGGATSEPSLAARNARNSAGKAAIGRTAASFVEDGMMIVIDSGSTTSMLAAALGGRSDLSQLQVLTNSLPIASALCRARGVRVTMLGGEIDANDEAAFGLDAIAALAHFRVDMAFVGAGRRLAGRRFHRLFSPRRRAAPRDAGLRAKRICACRSKQIRASHADPDPAGGQCRRADRGPAAGNFPAPPPRPRGGT